MLDQKENTYFSYICLQYVSKMDHRVDEDHLDLDLILIEIDWIRFDMDGNLSSDDPLFNSNIKLILIQQLKLSFIS